MDEASVHTRGPVFARLAELINRRPWQLLVVVVFITVVAALLGGGVREHLKPRGFDVAGSDSARAREIIAEASGVDPANGVLAWVRLPGPIAAAESQRMVAAVEARLRRDPAVVAVLDWRSAHNPAMVGHDGRSTYLIAALRRLDDEQQEQAGARLLTAFGDDPRVRLGGNPVANHEISTTIEEDLRRAELLALPLILLLSFVIFRGFVASLLAPLAGAITVLVSFFLLRELAALTSVSIYALNLVTGLSIGLSIDWSLLLLSRYREERTRTADLRLALARALTRAGHTIVFSAAIVAASMATLLVFPLRFLQSMGYGGLIASTVAMLTALIVLPVILRLLGARVDALTLPRWRDPARLTRPTPVWRGIARLATRHAAAVALVVIVILLAIASPVLGVRWTTVDASSLPTSARAFQADQAINHSSEFMPNSGVPFYLAVNAAPGAHAAVAAVAEQARHLTGVRAVTPPQRLDADTWQINLVAADTPFSDSTQHLVRELHALPSSIPIFVGGDAAAFYDERAAIGSRLLLAILLLSAATLIILFLLTGSLLAPPLALLMNALTLAAAFGALILIFQDGRFESALHYTSQHALDLTIPLVLAALVFAISTDYGVFLLSRIREARAHARPEHHAVAGSVATIGRIVTSAAVLFAVSIGVFGTSNIVVLKILGIGAAIAVLADALLVRCLLLPATLTLLGHHTWSLPPALSRLNTRIDPHQHHDHTPEPTPIPDPADQVTMTR
jgi:RND superfamily putative drug exporter